MQKTTVKKIVFPIMICAVFVGLILVIRSCSGGKERVFGYEKVSVGDVVKTVSVSGVLEVIDAYSILSKTGGMVIKVYADFNQEVTKGQLLVKLDSSAVDQEILRIQTQMETAKLEMQAQERDLEVKRNMFKDNLISASAMQQAELVYKTALSRSRNNQFSLKNALKEKNATTVTAPLSGTIISRMVQENMPVGNGSQLFVLAPNLKKMRLLITVDESDIGLIKNGQKVTFTVSAYPDKKFDGEITQVRITPIAQGGIVTYQSVVTCNNDQLLLKPGMTATATVEVAKKPNVLRVRNHAFSVSPNGETFDAVKKIIWRKSRNPIEDALEFIEVKTGLEGDQYTEIVSKNIKRGEKVLVKVTEVKAK